MASSAVDARVTPARPDLAAAHLKGVVDAARYVDGEERTVTAPVLDLRPRPDASASLDTQALYGEPVRIYERKDGWVWLQLQTDGYVGYARADGVGPNTSPPDHRVTALRAPVFSKADLKSPVDRFLPMNACVAVMGRDCAYLRIGDHAWLSDRHVAPVARKDADWVAVAERCLGAPYLWGGKTPDGLDCSGLVQIALHAAGLACPRDTDMQEQALGVSIDQNAQLRRGDLIFWKGHVGVMRSETELLHANAFHMAVAIELAADAIVRIAAKGTPVSSVRRLTVTS